jgi:aryl-alcohol dehydrogenase (NADP+)
VRVVTARGGGSLGVIPYNPLAGGLLTGKHDFSAGPTQGTRLRLGTAAQRYQERYWHERSFATDVMQRGAL